MSDSINFLLTNISMSISNAIWPPPIIEPMSPIKEGIGPPDELVVDVFDEEEDEENDIDDFDVPSALTVEVAICCEAC